MWTKLLPVAVILSFCLILTNSVVLAQSPSSNVSPEDKEPAIQVTANTEGKLQTVTIPASKLLFQLVPHFDDNGNLLNFDINLKPELKDLYNQIGPQSGLKTVFVYPIFTQAAYGTNGFYNYYKGKCDARCLTVSIPKPAGFYSSSGDASVILNLLGYPFLTDVDIDKNPDLLKQYDRVIILHNEYVSKREFDAITSHPDVIFLYPNALYAEVKTDYTNNTITLVRGHGFPGPSIKNGFDWKDDNSRYESDVFCNHWRLYLTMGGDSMLNCYPEYALLTSKDMLMKLQANDPTNLLDDISNWLMYDKPETTAAMLADLDINGTYTPYWVKSPATMLVKNEITKVEFLKMLDYLAGNDIVR